MKKVIKFMSFFLLLALLFVVSWSGRNMRKELRCEGVDVQVDTRGGLYFVTPEMILDSMRISEDSLLGKPLEDINIYLLEEFIDSNDNIEKAELYLTIAGKLCAKVKQRKPILRVFDSGKSYYLDENLHQFPLSETYSARVKQVYWNGYTEKRVQMLEKLLEALDEDEFMKAQLTAIEFDEKNEIVLYPRVGDQKIILGDVVDVEEKFKKLKVFYQQGLAKMGWNRYSLINLKYKDQVVCTKK